MVTLTHCCSPQVSDPDLYISMKTTLMRSLQQSVLMKQFALKNDILVRFHSHGPNEPVNYCLVCAEEVSCWPARLCSTFSSHQFLFQVFNIFFVKEHEKKQVVHCLRCARTVSKEDFASWICFGKNAIFRGDLELS